MEILRGQRNPDFFTSQRVPLGRVMVNWSHPLANGLLAMFIPGSPTMGFSDITGNTPALVPVVSGSTVIGQSPIGPSLKSSVLSSGLISPSGLSPVLQVTATVSLFWKGQQLAGSSGDCAGFGVKANNAAGQQQSYLLYQDGTTFTGLFTHGDGQLCQTSNSTFPTGMWSQGGTIAAGVTGGGILYQNGAHVSNVAGAVSATPFSYTGTAVLCVGADSVSGVSSGWNVSVCAIWGRVLSPSEMAWVDARPFSMLVPATPRVFHTPPAGASAYLRAMYRPPPIQIWDH
jgi:hypothetical protein